MPDRCCVVGCRSGYGDKKTSTEGVTMHQFPLSNRVLVSKWLANLARRDFTPTKTSKVCSLHFNADEFKESRTDANWWRRRKHTSEKRTNRMLKPDAVPTVFPERPSFMSSRKTYKRSREASTAESRQKKAKATEDAKEAKDREAIARAAAEAEQFETERRQDLIAGMDALEIRLRADRSHGFDVIKKESSLLLCLIDEKSGMPQISACISVKENFDHGFARLHLSVFCYGKLIDYENFPRLKEGAIKRYSEVVHLMEAVKQGCSESPKLS